jgi:hypothetical protein
MNSTSRITATGNWPAGVGDGNTAIPSYPSSIFLNSTLECKIIGIGMALLMILQDHNQDEHQYTVKDFF